MIAAVLLVAVLAGRIGAPPYVPDGMRIEWYDVRGRHLEDLRKERGVYLWQMKRGDLVVARGKTVVR